MSLQWEGISGLFLENFGGSHIFTSLFFLLAIWGLLLFIRASKEIFVACTALYFYFLIPAGFMPAWTFFSLLILAGISLGKSIIDLFFGGN